MSKLRKRPAIWIAEGVLGAAIIYGIYVGWSEFAFAALAILGTTIGKLVESEEATERESDKEKGP